MIEALNVDVEIPEYMNYGSLGYVLAHEFGHSCGTADKLFSEFAENDPNSEIEFLKRSKCIENQYGNYSVTEDGLKVKNQN